MNTREQFEAAWRKEYPLHSSTAFTRSGFDPERYANTRVQDGWLMWQASRATPADHSAAYAGAREDLVIWKKRALEAEELNRKFMREINGPTFMGEPADHIGDAAEKVDADSVPVAMMSYEEVAQKHSDRYRVENNASMFAQWKVVCGTGTRKIFTGTKIQCFEAAAELTTAFLDGVYAASQAPQPEAQSVPGTVIDTNDVLNAMEEAGFTHHELNNFRIRAACLKLLQHTFEENPDGPTT